MTAAYQIESICEVFGAACQYFELLIQELYGENGTCMEHGEIESLIRRMGTELMRLLMQAHLDLRAKREPRRHDLTGADGSPLPHCRPNRTRGLMTLFGEVVVRRKGYSSDGAKSLFPMDAELNLPPDKYSHGLRRRVGDEVAGESFDEAVETIKETTGGKVPKRQTEEVVVALAQDFEAFYSRREADEAEATADILVMSVDQKGVVMRKEDLRPATQKAAGKDGQRHGARLCPGEKPNRKRMATVATVYSVEATERSPEMIMGLGPDRPARAGCSNKRVWASLEQEPGEVIEAMFAEALRRDPEKKRPWAVLLDGAEKQLDCVLALVLKHRPDASVVVDFIHVLEYVWKAAYVFYAVGSKEAEQWVAERALLILKGQARSVASEMRRSARLSALRSKKRKPVDKCADYLEKYDILLDYHEFLNQGLPIATGVIEGACRHLIKDRMDITGARWGLKRAEAVLRIRSLRASGDFDAYGAFHLARERKRNHPLLCHSVPHPMTADAAKAESNDQETELQDAA